MRHRRLHIPLILLALLVVFSGCRPEPIDSINQDKSNFSKEEQLVLGSEIMTSIRSNSVSFPILDRDQYEEVYLYLQHSILDVAVNTGVVKRRNDFDWKVTVIHDDTDRNAFILPGGELFIYTGLLKFLKNNAELMGVVAHEIAYADGEFVIDNLKDQFNWPELRAIVEGTDRSRIDEVAEFFRIIDYSKDAVVHADTFAISLLCPFNYDAAGLRDVLLNANSDLDGIEWVQRKSYDIPNRISLIEEVLESKGCEGGGNAKLTEEYEQFLKRLP